MILAAKKNGIKKVIIPQASSKCRCTDYEIIKYRGKISGPIMDRIDIQKEVHPVNFFEMENKAMLYSSLELRKRVEAARKIQQERYSLEEGINCNAQMTTSLIKKYCEMEADSLDLLKETSEKYGYSARVIHKLPGVIYLRRRYFKAHGWNCWCKAMHTGCKTMLH